MLGSSRFHILRLCRNFHSSGIRCGEPPLKSYLPLKNPVSLMWAKQVPLPLKYGSGLVATALVLTQFHPNTVGTVAPPILVAGYWLNRQVNERAYQNLLSLIGPDSPRAIIKKYDESDVNNVLKGIENEYDHFTAQLFPQVEKILVDKIIDDARQNRAGTLIDENNQVKVHLGESAETFVTLEAEVGEEDGAFLSFISLSIPFYSSGDKSNRRRLGVLQVALLEDSSGESPKTEYKIAIQLWPFRMFLRPEQIC